MEKYNQISKKKFFVKIVKKRDKTTLQGSIDLNGIKKNENHF